MKLIVTEHQKKLIADNLGNNIVITFEVYTLYGYYVTLSLEIDLFLGFGYIWDIIDECIEFAVKAEIKEIEVEYLN